MTCDETLALLMEPLHDYDYLDKVSAWQRDRTPSSIQEIDMSWLEELLAHFLSSAEDLVATTEEPYFQAWLLNDWTIDNMSFQELREYLH
jgi:hypothetical protein